MYKIVKSGSARNGKIHVGDKVIYCPEYAGSMAWHGIVARLYTRPFGGTWAEVETKMGLRTMCVCALYGDGKPDERYIRRLHEAQNALKGGE